MCFLFEMINIPSFLLPISCFPPLVMMIHCQTASSASYTFHRLCTSWIRSTPPIIQSALHRTRVEFQIMAPSLWRRAAGGGSADATAPSVNLSDVAIGMISLCGSLIVFGAVLALLLYRARREERRRFELGERRRQAVVAKALSGRTSRSATPTIPPIPIQPRLRSPTIVRLKALAAKPHHPVLVANGPRLRRSPEKGSLLDMSDHRSAQLLSRTEMRNQIPPPRMLSRPASASSKLRSREASALNPLHPSVKADQRVLQHETVEKALPGSRVNSEATSRRYGKSVGTGRHPVPVDAGRLGNKKSPHPNLWISRSSTSIRDQNSGTHPGSAPPPLPPGAGALKPRNGSWGLIDLHRNWPGSFSSLGSSNTAILALGASPQADHRRNNAASIPPELDSDASTESVVGLAKTLSEQALDQEDRSRPRFQIFRESSKRQRPATSQDRKPLGHNDFSKGFNPLRINWGIGSPKLPPPSRQVAPPERVSSKQTSLGGRGVQQDPSASTRNSRGQTARRPDTSYQPVGRPKILPYGPRPMPQQSLDPAGQYTSGRPRNGMARPKDVRLVKEDSFTIHQMSLARQPDLSPIPSVSDLSNTPGLSSLGEPGLDLSFDDHVLLACKENIDPVKGIPRPSPISSPAFVSRTASRLSICSTPKADDIIIAELEDTSPTRPAASLNMLKVPTPMSNDHLSSSGLQSWSTGHLFSDSGPTTLAISSSIQSQTRANYQLSSPRDPAPFLFGGVQARTIPRTARLPPLQLSSHDPPSPEQADFPSSPPLRPSPAPVSNFREPPTVQLWGNAIVRKGSLEDSDFELATRRSSSANKPPSIMSSKAAAATVRSSVLALRRMNSASSFQSERWGKFMNRPEGPESPPGPSMPPSPVTGLGKRMIEFQKNQNRQEREQSPLRQRSRAVTEAEREKRRQRATKCGEMVTGKDGVARWTSIGRQRKRQQMQEQKKRASMIKETDEKDSHRSPPMVVRARDRLLEQRRRSGGGNKKFELGSSPLAWRNEKLAGLAC